MGGSEAADGKLTCQLAVSSKALSGLSTESRVLSTEPKLLSANGIVLSAWRKDLRVSPQRRRVRKGKKFCPIGRRQLGKRPDLYADKLLFVVVSRQTKKEFSAPSAVSFVSLPSCTSRPSWSIILSPRRARRSRSLDHCSCQERKGHKDCFTPSAVNKS